MAEWTPPKNAKAKEPNKKWTPPANAVKKKSEPLESPSQELESPSQTTPQSKPKYIWGESTPEVELSAPSTAEIAIETERVRPDIIAEQVSELREENKKKEEESKRRKELGQKFQEYTIPEMEERTFKANKNAQATTKQVSEFIKQIEPIKDQYDRLVLEGKEAGLIKKEGDKLMVSDENLLNELNNLSSALNSMQEEYSFLEQIRQNDLSDYQQKLLEEDGRKAIEGNFGGVTWNNILSGIGESTAGITDALMLPMAYLMPEEALGVDEEGNPLTPAEAAQFVSETLSPDIERGLVETIGDPTTTEEYIEEFNKSFLGQAYSGVTKSLVPALTSRTPVMLFGQGVNAMGKSLEGTNLSPEEKYVYKIIGGVATAALEKAGIDAMMGKNPLVKKITNDYLRFSLQNGKRITATNAAKFFGQLNIRALGEAATETAQATEETVQQLLTNAIKDEDIFDMGGLKEEVGEIMYEGALGYAGGLMMTAPISFVQLSKANKANPQLFELTEDVARNENYIGEVTKLLNIQLEKGEISQDEYNGYIQDAQDATEAISEIDPDLPPKERQKAFELIIKQKEIQRQTEGKKVVDPNKIEQNEAIEEELKEMSTPKEAKENTDGGVAQRKEVQEEQIKPKEDAKETEAVREEGITEQPQEQSVGDMREANEAEATQEAEEIKVGDTVKATVDTYKSGKRVQTTQQAEVVSVNEDGTYNLKKGKLTFKDVKPVSIKKFSPSQSVESETSGLTKEGANKAKKAIEDKTPKKLNFTEKIEKAVRRWNRRILDRQGNIKTILDRSGLKKVTDRLVTLKGAAGRAKFWYEKADKEIFGGLSNKELDLFNAVSTYRRIIAIDNNRSERGLNPVSHPNNITGVDAQARMAELKKENPELFNKINERADKYFDVYRGLLKKAKDAGIISKELYDNMVEVDYQPRRFMQHLTDFEGNLSEDEASRIANDYGLSKPMIKAMKEGSEDALNTNSPWLLASYMNSVEKRIFQNEVARKLAKEFSKVQKRRNELKSKGKLTKSEKAELEWLNEANDIIIDNPIIGYTKNGNPIYKFEKTKPNYQTLYYYKDGVQHRMMLREDMYSEWMDNKRVINNPKVSKVISNMTGASLLKTMATGINPLFVATNLPRDFFHILTFTDAYGSFLPKSSVELMADFIKANKEMNKGFKSEKFVDFVEYGGMMDFLSTQGAFNDKNTVKNLLGSVAQKKNIDKVKKVFDVLTILNTRSEIGFRVAVFNRAVSKGMKEINSREFNSKEERQEAIDDLKYSAARQAREIIDFNQGGYWTKDAESVLPYINAATQGFRVAAQYTAKNPIKASYKMAQGAVMTSVGGVATSIGLIALLRGDDEESKDMTNTQIWVDTMEGVSEYEKRAYAIIPTGTKDDDGNWQYLRISKTQQLRPLFVASDYIVENQMREMTDRKTIGESVIIDNVLESINNDYLPISPTPKSAASTITRNPLVGGGLSALTGYDFFRDQDISWDIDKVPLKREGYYSKNMPEFYKDLADATGASPARTKKFVEGFLTNPSNNPYTALIYGIGEATSDGSKTITESMAEPVKQLGEGVVSKFFKSTSEYNKSARSKKELERLENEIRVEDVDENHKLKELSKDMVGKKEATKEVKDFIKSLPEYKRSSSLNRIIKYANTPKSSHSVLDIIFEKNPKIQALRFKNLYGDIDDESVKKAIMELKTQGLKNPNALYIEYKALKNKNNKNDTTK